MKKVKFLFLTCLLASICILQSCKDQTKDITKHSAPAARTMATQSSCEECEWQYELARIQCSGGNIPVAPLSEGQKSARFDDPGCMREAWENYQSCLYGYDIPSSFGTQICHIDTRVDIDRFLGIPVEINVYVTFYTVDTYTRQGGCNNAAPTTRLQKRVIGTTSASSRSVWDEDRIREKTANAIAAKLQELIGQGYIPILTPDEIGAGVNKCGI